MTFIVENHHYYAWCRDCPFTGPLRFKRDLAAGDAAEHVAEKHAGGTIGADVDGADVEPWHPTPRPAGLPESTPGQSRKPSRGEIVGGRRRTGGGK